MENHGHGKIRITVLVGLIVLIITIMPLLLITITTYSTAKKTLVEQSYSFTSDILDVHAQNLENSITTISSLADRILTSYFITEFRQYGSEGSQSTLDHPTLERNLGIYLGIENIKSIDVMFLNGKVLTTRQEDDPKRLYSEAMIDDLLQKSIELGDEPYYAGEITIVDGVTTDKLMSLIRPVWASGITQDQAIGILIISFPIDLITDDSFQEMSGINPEYLLVDLEGKVLNKDASETLIAEATPGLLESIDAENGYFTKPIDGQIHLFSYRKIVNPNSYLIMLVPLNSLMDMSSSLMGNSILILLISFLISLSIGVLAVSYMLMPFTKIIRAVQHIRSGNTDWSVRAPSSPIRELDTLSNWFNSYIETEQVHQDTEMELKNSERRYHSLFEDSPIPLWEEDFSEVIKAIEGLPLGNQTLEEYLAQHTDLIYQLISRLKILDVNQATLSLYKTSSKEQIVENTGKIFQNVNANQIRQELIQMSKRANVFEMTLENSTFDGDVLDIRMRWSVLPGFEKYMERVIVSTMDITQEMKEELLKSTIMQITQETSTAATLHDLYHSIHRTLSKIMPAENLYIALYDEESGMVSFPYFVDQYDEPPKPHPFGNGWTEYVIRTGKTSLLSRDLVTKLQDEEGIQNTGADLIDWLGVPLNVKDRTIGVIAVQTYEVGRRYTQEHCDWLTIVSTQIAMAIDRKRAEEALIFSSTHDKLTGLYNRAYFEEEVNRLAAGRQNPVGVIMIDVDELKATNDTLGHAEGDEVLRATSRVLQQAFRTNDLVARIGGDEFVVLLPYSTEPVVEKAVVRIRKFLDKNNQAGNRTNVSLSIGTACTEAGISLTEAIKLADQSMYGAKKQFRNK